MCVCVCVLLSFVLFCFVFPVEAGKSKGLITSWNGSIFVSCFQLCRGFVSILCVGVCVCGGGGVLLRAYMRVCVRVYM